MGITEWLKKHSGNKDKKQKKEGPKNRAERRAEMKFTGKGNVMLTCCSMMHRHTLNWPLATQIQKHLAKERAAKEVRETKGR
jgi:hypothetical protein